MENTEPQIDEFVPQALPDFMRREFPPKEPLIEGILYRRDRGSLTGRRRNGKTSLLMNIGLAGPLGYKAILGYPILHPYRTLTFYLEDDGRELQDKLRRMVGNVLPKNFFLYVQDDFADRDIKADISNPKFINFVCNAAKAARPDLIIFDNLGELIGADYTNSTKIHDLSQFTRKLGTEHNCATLVAAHPRKRNKQDKIVSLVNDTEQFFEECMGSSHFINSTGSLWGIERSGDETTLCLGAQRMGDGATFTRVEMDPRGWFQRVSDDKVNQQLALTTQKRKDAWKLLPTEFTYRQAIEVVKPVMSDSSFHALFKELQRLQMVQPAGGNTWRKVG